MMLSLAISQQAFIFGYITMGYTHDGPMDTDARTH